MDPFTILWLVWLGVFLVIELSAVFRPKLGDTLSENVWRWFSITKRGSWWIVRRVTFGLFWLALGWHFMVGSTVKWVVITGIPLALVIIGTEVWSKLDMGLRDKIGKYFALHWLKGEAKGDGLLAKILKLFDGWKLFIAVGVLFGVRVWDQAHNGHAGEMIGAILAALGWLPPGEWSGESMTAAAASGLAVIAWFHKLWKAQKQARAGAAPSELLSAEGYAKVTK